MKTHILLVLVPLLATSALAAAPEVGESLARVTFYSAQRCPYGFQSATGVRLREGVSCAVDPRRIPYGARVNIPGLGRRFAVDTGSAVKSRRAARYAGRSAAERAALVVDVFVVHGRTEDQLSREFPTFTQISWHKP